MIAYCYDENGIYMGQEETQESPLQPGIFLLPAQATFVEVPEFDSSIDRAVWTADGWIVEKIPVEVVEEVPIFENESSLSVEEQQAIKQSILEKLRAIGLTDEELFMIFGEN